MDASIAAIDTPGGLQQQIIDLQPMMMQLPQVDCPVVHRFGPGVYIREVSAPAGTFAVGHRQTQDHLNVLLQGRVAVLSDDGSVHELAAPLVFVGKPGRKVGYVMEDMVWQNIYATTETDVEKLEAMFLDKHESWAEHLVSTAPAPRLADRAAYADMLAEIGVSEETVRAESERTDTMTVLPHGGYKIKVGASAIHGKGLMATANIAAGEEIVPARIGDYRTIAGRYANHAAEPNARPEIRGNEVLLVATRDICGCRGGRDGEEITIDYRESFKIAVMLNRGVLCQDFGQQLRQ